MSKFITIPMFPLSILPLPGELVPLHIFEPRYKQLLQEAEIKDISFGILFNHPMNKGKVGALVKLESVIKRYTKGESDIIVKCIDLFTLDTLSNFYRDKLFPGGEVTMWNVDVQLPVSLTLAEEFMQYLELQNRNVPWKQFSVFEIAIELNLDFEDRIRFIFCDSDKKESFISARLKYQKHILREAVKAKDVFHLN